MCKNLVFKTQNVHLGSKNSEVFDSASSKETFLTKFRKILTTQPKMSHSPSGSHNSGSDSSGSGSENNTSESDSDTSQKLSKEKRSSKSHSPELVKEDHTKRSRDERSNSKSPPPKRSRNEKDEKASSKDNNKMAEAPGKGSESETILTRTGGAYIPPAKLRMMQQNITDKSSLAFQVSCT